MAIMAAYLLSGIFLALAARRPGDELSTAFAAIVLALVGVGLQFFEYSTLGFGPTSGGLRQRLLRLDRDLCARCALGRLLDGNPDRDGLAQPSEVNWPTSTRACIERASAPAPRSGRSTWRSA